MSITKLSPKQLDTLISAMEAHHMAMGGMVQATSRPFMFQGRSGPVKKFEEGGPTSGEGGTGEGGSYTHADDMRQDAAQDRADTSSYSSSGSGSSDWGGSRSSEASRSEPSGSGSGMGIRSEAGSEGSPSYDNSSASAVAGLTGGAGNGQENVPDYGNSLRSEASALGSLIGSSDLNNGTGLVPPAMVGSGYVEPPRFAGPEMVGGIGPDSYGTDPNSFRVLKLDANQIANMANMGQAENGNILSRFPGAGNDGEMSLGATLGNFLSRAATNDAGPKGTGTGNVNDVLSAPNQYSPLNDYNGDLSKLKSAPESTSDLTNRILADIAVNPNNQQNSMDYANVPVTLNSGKAGRDTIRAVTAMANDPNSVTYGDGNAQQTYGVRPGNSEPSPYAVTFAHEIMPQMMALAGNSGALTASNDPSPTYTRPALPSAPVPASRNILSSILGVSPAFAGYSEPSRPLSSYEGMPTSARSYTGISAPENTFSEANFRPSLGPSNYEGNTPNYSRALSMAMNDPTVGAAYGSPSSASIGQGITPEAPAYQGMPWAGGQSQYAGGADVSPRAFGNGQDMASNAPQGSFGQGLSPSPYNSGMSVNPMAFASNSSLSPSAQMASMGSGITPSAPAYQGMPWSGGQSPDYHDRNLAGLNGVGPSPAGDTQSAYNDPRDPAQGYDPLSGRMTPSQYDRYALASSFGAPRTQEASNSQGYPLARMPMSTSSFGDMPNPGYGLPGMVDPSGLANAMRPPNEFGAPLDKFAFNDGNDRDTGGSPAARLHHLNDGGAHIATEGPGFENKGDIPPRSGVDPTNNGQVNPRWSDSVAGKIVGGIGNAGLGFFGGPLGSAAVLGDKLISGQTPGTQLINALQRGYENGTWAPGSPQINDHTNMAMNAYDRNSGGFGGSPLTGGIMNGYNPSSLGGPFNAIGNINRYTGAFAGTNPGVNETNTGTSTLPALVQAALRARAEDPIDYEHYGQRPMHSYFNYS